MLLNVTVVSSPVTLFNANAGMIKAYMQKWV